MLKTASSVINAIGALNYAGTWNASTNNPTLTSGVGTKGNYYVVSVAGTTTLDGISLWSVGDWAVFNGTAWQKVDGASSEAFSSITVTGLTGYMYANNTSPVTASTTIPNAGLANSTTTLGNATLTLGSTTSTVGNLTLNNVTVNNVATTFPNSFLANSSLTVNGTSIALGGSGTITAANPNALTVSTGLQLNSGTTYDGSSAKTVSISNTTVTAASYGNASTVATFTVNAQGQLTAAGNSTISIAPSQINATIPNSGLTNSSITLGNATLTLGGTTSTVGNLTLNNVTINSGNATVSSLNTGSAAFYSGNKSINASTATNFAQFNFTSSSSNLTLKIKINAWLGTNTGGTAYGGQSSEWVANFNTYGGTPRTPTITNINSQAWQQDGYITATYAVTVSNSSSNLTLTITQTPAGGGSGSVNGGIVYYSIEAIGGGTFTAL